MKDYAECNSADVLRIDGLNRYNPSRHNVTMDDRLSKLAKVASASMRGEKVDPKWIYDESLALLEQSEAFHTNALWHTVVDSARALNDTGEYALGGEIFELLLQKARDRRYPKIEFDALEGLAESWFYLGDKDRAFQYLEVGLALATRLKRSQIIERFQDTIDQFREGKISFTGVIKAPADANTGQMKRKAHVSSLLKKERNR